MLIAHGSGRETRNSHRYLLSEATSAPGGKSSRSLAPDMRRQELGIGVGIGIGIGIGIGGIGLRYTVTV